MFGMRNIFRPFRDLTEAVQSLSEHVRQLRQGLARERPAMDRLEALEHSRATWEAEMEGFLLKADGKLKAANNSEARERTMRKAYEAIADPFDPDSEEGISPEQQHLRLGNAPPSEEEGVYDVPVGVEGEDWKARALRAKFM